jgi:hypothetical protein
VVGTLREARGNTGVRGDELLERALKSKVDHAIVVAVYALRSLRGTVGDEGLMYSYKVSRSRRDRMELGPVVVDMGVVNILSTVTLEQSTMYYVLLHLGGWDLYVGVDYLEKPEDYIRANTVFRSNLGLTPASKLVDMLGELFKERVYTVAELPLDDQVDLALWVLEGFKSSLKDHLEKLSPTLLPLHHTFKALGVKPPEYLASALTALLSLKVEESLGKQDVLGLRELIRMTESLGTPLGPWVRELVALKLIELLDRLEVDPTNTRVLEGALDLALTLDGMGALGDRLVEEARIRVALARKRYYADMRRAAETGDEVSWGWVKLFTSLAKLLRVRV